MTKTQITTEQAQRKVDAIDKRIDAVRAELLRNETVDEMSAASWQAAWDRHPVLQEIERSLFDRRYDAQTLHSSLAAKDAKAAERKAAREWLARDREQRRSACALCGTALAA